MCTEIIIDYDTIYEPNEWDTVIDCNKKPDVTAAEPFSNDSKHEGDITNYRL